MKYATTLVAVLIAAEATSQTWILRERTMNDNGRIEEKSVIIRTDLQKQLDSLRTANETLMDMNADNERRLASIESELRWHAKVNAVQNSRLMSIANRKDWSFNVLLGLGASTTFGSLDGSYGVTVGGMVTTPDKSLRYSLTVDVGGISNRPNTVQGGIGIRGSVQLRILPQFYAVAEPRLLIHKSHISKRGLQQFALGVGGIYQYKSLFIQAVPLGFSMSLNTQLGVESYSAGVPYYSPSVCVGVVL